MFNSLIKRTFYWIKLFSLHCVRQEAENITSDRIYSGTDEELEIGTRIKRVLQSESFHYSSAHDIDLIFRPSSVGDNGVIDQIITQKQYEFGWYPQGKKVYSLFARLKSEGVSPLIVDGGANIGVSAVWFDMKFPGSTIAAIEPDVENCLLLRTNCRTKNIFVYPYALADQVKTMYLHDPDGADWSFQLSDSLGQAVECISVQDVLRDFPAFDYQPFILKLDIEGAEALVFAGKCDWLPRFAMVIIELHDWMLPGKRTSRNFLKAVLAHDFEVISRGENLFCFNPKI